MNRILSNFQMFRLKVVLRLSAYWIYLPMPLAMKVMRWLRHEFQIQLSEVQLVYTARQIRQHKHCKLIVFGLGNDSRLWAAINRHGRSVFFEEDQQWCHKIASQSSRIEAYWVQYHTKMSQWREYLDHPSLLSIPMPENISNVDWDLVLVDAPRGGGDPDPGRMTSIYMSRQLIKGGGDVLVHDCERPLEEAYTDRYLQQENFVTSLPGYPGMLKHYRFG